MSSFNFNKVKKRFMPVTLKSGKTLLVDTPTKRGIEEFTKIDDASLDEMYSVVAKLLSMNKNKETITADELGDYKIDEIVQFISEYSQFISGQLAGKN